MQKYFDLVKLFLETKPKEFWPYDPYLFWGQVLLLVFLIILLIYRLTRSSKSQAEKQYDKLRVKDYKISTKDAFHNALTKTRNSFLSKLDPFLGGALKSEEKFYDELEEILICADVGLETTTSLIENLKHKAKDSKSSTDKLSALRELIEDIFNDLPKPPEKKDSPHVIMTIGVNGVGKTTTIGKITCQLKKKIENPHHGSIVLTAADTFRAAAIEQLSVWAERNDAKIIKHKHGADPSAVAFDAIKHAQSKDFVEYIIIDTAGRLHTKVNLMEELKKIKRTIKKLLPDAPHETLLVVDATTGQNALQQAKIFHEALEIDAIALTKLDGTAKGGILIQIANELKIPIKYVGCGEGIDDLKHFDSKLFTESLFT